jgi:molybdopterin synthase catalytic subunit
MPRFEVLLFAGLRQKMGRRSVSVDLPDQASAGDLIDEISRKFPAIAHQLAQCRVAVDHSFVDANETVTSGGEIALIPPVSGGHDGPTGSGERPAPIHLGPQPLDIGRAIAAVAHRGAGGITTFLGNVREHSRGLTIAYLDYEAYEPMAIKVMSRIARELETREAGSRVAIHHRLGRLAIGETAVIIAASAPHRAAAFAACRAAIEALKTDVPIWKRETGVDGSIWIGQGP